VPPVVGSARDPPFASEPLALLVVPPKPNTPPVLVKLTVRDPPLALEPPPLLVVPLEPSAPPVLVELVAPELTLDWEPPTLLLVPPDSETPRVPAELAELDEQAAPATISATKNMDRRMDFMGIPFFECRRVRKSERCFFVAAQSGPICGQPSKS
jgi:hypothetical protein